MKLYRFSKNNQKRNLIKVRPEEVELFHADGRTDRQIDKTKLTVAFSKFANSPKNSFINYKCATAESVHIMHCFTTTQLDYSLVYPRTG
jgi:hypothetical protein